MTNSCVSDFTLTHAAILLLLSFLFVGLIVHHEHIGSYSKASTLSFKLGLLPVGQHNAILIAIGERDRVKLSEVIYV